MKLIRLPEMLARTGLSRTRAYEAIRAGNFPAPVKIGPRAVGWVAEEIDCWISERVACRESADA